MVKAEEMVLDGRPKNTLLAGMRTTAWLTYLMRQAMTEDSGDLTRKLFNVPSNRTLSATTDSGKVPNIRWDKYISHETGPSKSILNRVEQTELGHGSRAVFDHGPIENGETVNLWCVFEMDFDAMWEPIKAVCPDLETWRKTGVPFSRMVKWMALSFVRSTEWRKLNFKDPTTHPKVNAVVTAYQDKHFTPSLKYLAATMAMWRFALHHGESMAQMEYLVRGLLTEPCKDLLSSYGIYSQFKLAFHHMEIHDLVRRREFELAKKQLAKLIQEEARA
jgi:hypothetical protein